MVNLSSKIDVDRESWFGRMNTSKGIKPKRNEKVDRMNTYYVLMIDNISVKAFINTVKADSLNEAKMLSTME